MRRGLTLIETLAVIAIVAVLASLLFPVLAQAKERANRSSCVEALHQSFIALKLYQADHDGKDVGSVAEMGLPILPILAAVPELRRIANCRRVPSEKIKDPRTYPYIYQPDDGSFPEVSIWKNYVVSHGDRAVLLTDLNHNLLSEPLESRFYTHTGLAVLYGGTAFERTRPGDPSDLHWWDDPGAQP